MALLLLVAVYGLWKRRQASASLGISIGSNPSTTQMLVNAAPLVVAAAATANTPRVPDWLHALAGAVGGMASFAITYPLATVAARLQVQEKVLKHDDSKGSPPNPDNNSASGAKAFPASKDLPADYYRGALHALITIYNQEGLGALYHGLSSALLGVAASQGVFYYFYAKLQRIARRAMRRRRGLKDSIPDSAIVLATSTDLLLSSLAGAATAAITNPLWVVNTRLQVHRRARTSPTVQPTMDQSTTETQRRQAEAASENDVPTNDNYNFVHAILQILREEGIQGLFRGLAPALILVSNPTIQYAVFERLKVLGTILRSTSDGKRGTLGTWDFFWLGILAKAVATVCTYPYIVAKSVQHTRAASHSNEGTMALLQDVARREGVAGLYRGIRSKILQSTLTAGILFLTKEEITHLLTKALL